jgi:polyisoprenoid-binding protein YceI
MTTDNPSQANSPGPASPLTSAASWELDPSGSSVTISHKSIWGLVTVRGSFEQLSGSAEIQPGGTGRGSLNIGAASINTKHAKRDTHLKSGDFFKAADHPQIVVELTRAARQGDDGVAAQGTLTVAGVTRPFALTAKIAESTDQAITLKADTEFNRADFGMNWNQLGMIRGNAAVSIVARFVPAAAAS